MPDPKNVSPRASDRAKRLQAVAERLRTTGDIAGYTAARRLVLEDEAFQIAQEQAQKHGPTTG